MAKQLVFALLSLALFQGILAQFNVLPVFIAESVINEHKNAVNSNELSETTQKKEVTDAATPMNIPVHPKLMAGMLAEKSAVVHEVIPGRVKREEEFKKTQIGSVQRSRGRNSDIDSFLTELEKDISRTQHTRHNINPANQAPSWSYIPSATTERSFWKKVSDSFGSTYDQVKAKTKDFAKNFK